MPSLFRVTQTLRVCVQISYKNRKITILSMFLREYLNSDFIKAQYVGTSGVSGITYKALKLLMTQKVLFLKKYVFLLSNKVEQREVIG